MESAMGKRCGARLAVVIAAAVLLVLLVAAPAMAAPAATSLVASPSLSTVALGDTLTISATLTDTGSTLPVGGETVRVEQATSNSGPWSLTDLVSTDDTTGVASYDAILTQTTYFRFVFEGTGTYAAATSNVLTVLVTPFATSLTASPIESTVNIGDSATISALLMDTANDLPVGGETVRVEQAASNSGPWSLTDLVTTDDTTGVASYEFYPAATAYYRFVYEGTETYSPSTSNAISVVVTPIATSLVASPGLSTVKYGASPTISAVLRETDGALPIGGAELRVESATSTAGPWSLVQTVTTDGLSGSGSLAVTPMRTMYYRFVFAGTDTYATVTSGTLTIQVKPVLGTPTCPSSIKTNKSFTVKATVKPGAPDGPAVKIQAYRKHDGKWSKYKSAYSTTRSGTTCSVKIEIKDTGTFKFRATVAASSKFVAASSSYSKVMTVKK
jgi:hypothetical protein